MPRRKIPFSAGNFYHIYNRGNNRAAIFFERENYLYFLEKLRLYFAPESVRIHAYCLMPNHFHLLVELLIECSFSNLCKNLFISYTKAMNKRFRRTGHIFEGEFKSKNVDSKEYLLTLSRYIHANPSSARLVEKPELWEFSSYLDYLGERRGTLPYTKFILSHYKSVDEYRSFVEGFRESEFQEMGGEMFK